MEQLVFGRQTRFRIRLALISRSVQLAGFDHFVFDAGFHRGRPSRNPWVSSAGNGRLHRFEEPEATPPTPRALISIMRSGLPHWHSNFLSATSGQAGPHPLQGAGADRFEETR